MPDWGWRTGRQCPLLGLPEPRAHRYLVWKTGCGWTVAYGRLEIFRLIATGVPCWHLAMRTAKADGGRTGPDEPLAIVAEHECWGTS